MPEKKRLDNSSVAHRSPPKAAIAVARREEISRESISLKGRCAMPHVRYGDLYRRAAKPDSRMANRSTFSGTFNEGRAGARSELSLLSEDVPSMISVLTSVATCTDVTLQRPI